MRYRDETFSASEWIKSEREVRCAFFAEAWIGFGYGIMWRSSSCEARGFNDFFDDSHHSAVVFNLIRTFVDAP